MIAAGLTSDPKSGERAGRSRADVCCTSARWEVYASTQKPVAAENHQRLGPELVRNHVYGSLSGSSPRR